MSKERSSSLLMRMFPVNLLATVSSVSKTKKEPLILLKDKRESLVKSKHSNSPLKIQRSLREFLTTSTSKTLTQLGTTQRSKRSSANTEQLSQHQLWLTPKMLSASLLSSASRTPKILMLASKLLNKQFKS